VCKYYREVYDTKSVKDDEARLFEILSYVVMFIALASYDHEQSDLIHRIAADKNLEKLALYKQLIKSFTTSELMRWPKIEQLYKAELQKSFVFSPSTAEGVKRWKDLHHRVIEHNIRVVSKYYDRITLKRLTELLDLSMAETEEFLSKLVSSKTIYGKIDRVDGIVTFRRHQQPDEVLNSWAGNIHSLLDLIAKTKHLITKEEMLHQIKA
jgi:26S proteasome regulatory subunit N5